MSAHARFRTGKENAPPQKKGKAPAGGSDVDMDAVEDDFDALGGDEGADLETLAPSRKQAPPVSRKPSSSTSKPSTTARKPSAAIPSKKVVKGTLKAEDLAEAGQNAQEEGDDLQKEMDAISDEEAEEVPKRSGKAMNGKVAQGKGKAIPAESEAEGQASDTETKRKLADMSKQIATLKSQLDDKTNERDTFSQQLDSLLGKKAQPDKAYEALQETTSAQAKAQDTVIQSLETSNETLSKRNTSLAAELTALRAKLASATSSAAAPVPAVGAEVTGRGTDKAASDEMRKELKVLKEKYKGLKEEMAKREEAFALTTKDYQAELKLAKDAITIAERKAAHATSNPSSTAQAERAEDIAAGDATIKLYEDLTNFQITRVRFLEKGKVEFGCVQTSGARSLGFTLISSPIFNKDPSKPNGGRWGKQLYYHPRDLDKEVDRQFVARLETFGSPFVIPREQAYSFWQQLDAKISGNDDGDD